MNDQFAAEPGSVDDLPIRLLQRVCNEYFLDSAAALADVFGGDLVKGLVFLAILRANVGHLEHDSATARTYSTLDQPPPDDMRAPTTVYAVAKALGLTYETARRHVNWLIDKRFCSRTPDGLVVTAETLKLPALIRGNMRNLANFKRFMAAVKQAGLDDLV